MGTVSVRYGVAQAYGLLLGRPLTIIGLTWLPALFYAVGADFLIRHMTSAMMLAVPSSPGMLGQYPFFYFAALIAATALFGAIIAVPLTREALGLREERVAVHLVVGPREFRLFLGLLQYYALLAAVLVAVAVGSGIAISQSAHYAETHGFATFRNLPVETWFNSIAGAVAVLLFLALAVRFGFLLDPIAGAEDRVRLRRARLLSRGNFWPLAATLTLVGLPALLVLLACEATFGGVSAAGHYGIDPQRIDIFTAILAVGLVVLHALSAGASAGVYSEMAEISAQEREPARERDTGYGRSPATGHFAAASQAPELTAPQAMVIVTPEADTAFAPVAASQPPWMAPPPDAHFGSDPHDAPSATHAGGPAPDSSTQPHTIPAESSPEDAPTEPNAHMRESEGFLAEAPTGEATADVPDHALDSEFPPPPLDPAGAMSIQSGFHSSG